MNALSRNDYRAYRNDILSDIAGNGSSVAAKKALVNIRRAYYSLGPGTYLAELAATRRKCRRIRSFA